MAAIAGSRAKRAAASKGAGRVKKSSPEGRVALNMRIQPDLRNLIDRAAGVAGKNRTDFVLDGARQAAQATLLDQVHVRLNPEAYAAFLQRLDAPVKANARLRKTMQTSPVWS